MKRLPEKPDFADGLRPHCDKREGEHKCVRLEGHTGPGYTFTVDDKKNVTWYEMEVHV